MIDVSAATAIVLESVRRLPPEVTPITSSSLGQVLAAAVTADRDSPPFAKSLMDGFAVRSVDLAELPRTMPIAGEAPAGSTPGHVLQPGTTIRTFTGAPIPVGADAIVMQEFVTADATSATFSHPVAPGQYVLPQGKEMKAGEEILRIGDLLRPQEFGLLASVGRTTVSAYPCPRIAIISTGDELVEPMMKPGPAQIRNSNGTMLTAAAVRAGGLPRYLGIARDRRETLKSLIMEGLATADVLAISGGASVGKHDLVPELLAEAGVDLKFRNVNLKPGRPLLFGMHGATAVFGLPGNPVSSFVCFELFVRPVIRKLRGFDRPEPVWVPIPLARELSIDNDRPTYGPGKLIFDQQGVRVEPIGWFGSADLRGLVGADALIAVPAGKVMRSAGEAVPTLLLP